MGKTNHNGLFHLILSFDRLLPLLGCAPSHVETQVGKDERGCPVFACQQRFRAPIPCVKPALGCKPPSVQGITGYDGPRGCPTYGCYTDPVIEKDWKGNPINYCQ